MTPETPDPSPPETNVVLLKYMDDWKLKKLLNGGSLRVGSLWFSRPAGLTADPLEATFPALNESDEDFCRNAARIAGQNEEQAAIFRDRFFRMPMADIRTGIKVRAQLCGVSCWHECETESDRMWHEYVPTKKGIAIKTTCGDLENAIASPSLGFESIRSNKLSKTCIARVNYLAHSSDFSHFDGYWDLLRLKERETFSHEKEVRLIAKSPEWVDFEEQQSRPLCYDLKSLLDNLNASQKPKGFDLKIDLEKLIHAVIIDPRAGDDYAASVRADLQAAGLGGNLVQISDLDGQQF